VSTSPISTVLCVATGARSIWMHAPYTESSFGNSFHCKMKVTDGSTLGSLHHRWDNLRGVFFTCSRTPQQGMRQDCVLRSKVANLIMSTFIGLLPFCTQFPTPLLVFLEIKLPNKILCFCYAIFRIKPRALCLLDKCCTIWAMPPVPESTSKGNCSNFLEL
jgi:hypothetical protein